MARAKGTVMAEVVKFLRNHREAAGELLPESLHHYLNERLLASTWYPEEDLMQLLRAMVELLPDPDGDVWVWIGRRTAKLHFSGSYQNVLGGRHAFDAPEDRQAAARAVEVLWRSQHDTGRVKVTAEGAERSRIELSDYALPSREMCAILSGYIAEALRLMGAGDVAVHEIECRTAGARRCVWRVQWKQAAGA